jgi:serine protease
VDAAIGGTTPPDPGALAESEPNNSRAASQAVVAANTTVNGTMSSSTDTDYYNVALPAGKTLKSVLTPNGSSDYDLYVYNSNGTLIGSSERGSGLSDTVTVTNTGTGTLTRYVRVVFYSGGTGATNGKYTLKLTW